MTIEELSKLTQGDVVRHEPTGAGYIVLNNVGGVPLVIRSIQLHTGPDWSHVYTPTPVVVAPVPSLTDKFTELDKRGWTFEDDPCNRWASPDGYFYYSLDIAYKSRGCHPTKADIETKKRIALKSDLITRPAKSFAEARAVLVSAGWKNVCGRVWRSPAGALVDGTLAAYKIVTKHTDDGTCNAS